MKLRVILEEHHIVYHKLDDGVDNLLLDEVHCVEVEWEVAHFFTSKQRKKELKNRWLIELFNKRNNCLMRMISVVSIFLYTIDIDTKVVSVRAESLADFFTENHLEKWIRDFFIVFVKRLSSQDIDNICR